MCNMPCKYVDNSVDKNFSPKNFWRENEKKIFARSARDGGRGVPRGSVARGIRLKCI